MLDDFSFILPAKSRAWVLRLTKDSDELFLIEVCDLKLHVFAPFANVKVGRVMVPARHMDPHPCDLPDFPHLRELSL